VNSASNPVRVTLQIAAKAAELPSAKQFELWVNSAVNSGGRPVTDNSRITVRIVEEAESGALNGQYRHSARPTNVLAFPAGDDEYVHGDDVEPEIGDLVICAAVVEREAQEQSKSVAAHFAHMTVHGSLHLLGYDHTTEKEAAEMEGLEKQVLGMLGFPDPYRDDNQDLKRA